MFVLFALVHGEPALKWRLRKFSDIMHWGTGYEALLICYQTVSEITKKETFEEAILYTGFVCYG